MSDPVSSFLINLCAQLAANLITHIATKQGGDELLFRLFARLKSGTLSITLLVRMVWCALIDRVETVDKHLRVLDVAEAFSNMVSRHESWLFYFGGSIVLALFWKNTATIDAELVKYVPHWQHWYSPLTVLAFVGFEYAALANIAGLMYDRPMESCYSLRGTLSMAFTAVGVGIAVAECSHGFEGALFVLAALASAVIAALIRYRIIRGSDRGRPRVAVVRTRDLRTFALLQYEESRRHGGPPPWYVHHTHILDP